MTLLLLVEVSGQTVALPADAVAEIVAVPRLARVPSAAPALEGLMNLRGRPVPVARLARLLDLPRPPVGMFAAVVVLSRPEPSPWAVLVDRAVDVAGAEALERAPPGLSFNDCVRWAWPRPGGLVPVLEPDLLLDRRERQALEAFRDHAERRREDWAGVGGG